MHGILIDFSCANPWYPTIVFFLGNARRPGRRGNLTTPGPAIGFELVISMSAPLTADPATGRMSSKLLALNKDSARISTANVNTGSNDDRSFLIALLLDLFLRKSLIVCVRRFLNTLAVFGMITFLKLSLSKMDLWTARSKSQRLSRLPVRHKHCPAWS